MMTVGMSFGVLVLSCLTIPLFCWCCCCGYAPTAGCSDKAACCSTNSLFLMPPLCVVMQAFQESEDPSGVGIDLSKHDWEVSNPADEDDEDEDEERQARGSRSSSIGMDEDELLDRALLL